MPFGLTNAAQTLQRFSDQAIRCIPGVYAQIDDLPVASDTIDEHLQHLQQLRQLFMRLWEHDISINVEKCEFGKRPLQFLGHMVTSQGITPVPVEVDAIRYNTLSESRKTFRRFLRLINYYKRFILNCEAILQPLMSTLRGHGRTYHLLSEAIQAFENAKKALYKRRC